MNKTNEFISKKYGKISKIFDMPNFTRKGMIKNKIQLNDYIIFAKWVENSVECIDISKKKVPELKIIEVDYYIQDLQNRGISKIPSIIINSKVAYSGYDEVKKYLDGIS